MSSTQSENIFVIIDDEDGGVYVQSALQDAERVARNLVEEHSSSRVLIYSGTLLGVCSRQVAFNWEKTDDLRDT